MGMLEDVTTHLQGTSLGTLGTNLFMGRMPDTPNFAIAVFEYGGAPPIDTFRSGTTVRPPTIDRGRVQVMVRSTATATASSRAWDIYDTLGSVANQKLVGSSSGGTQYLSISPVQTPMMMPRDEQGRVRYVVNFDVWAHRT